MYYMNKTKRGLIIASAVVNLITSAVSLIMSILSFVLGDVINNLNNFMFIFSYSTNIVFCVLSFVAGLAGSIMLLYSVRNKGKYFRASQSLYIAGFVIVVICGSFVSWLLLFISLFVSDVIVMNKPEDLRKEEIKESKEFEEKKKKIEDLKRMRDNGLISEEEYKQKLFDLL